MCLYVVCYNSINIYYVFVKITLLWTPKEKVWIPLELGFPERINIRVSLIRCLQQHPGAFLSNEFWSKKNSIQISRVNKLKNAVWKSIPGTRYNKLLYKFLAWVDTHQVHLTAGNETTESHNFNVLATKMKVTMSCILKLLPQKNKQIYTPLITIHVVYKY